MRLRSFNGAAARVQRNAQRGTTIGSASYWASMGPLLVCSGIIYAQRQLAYGRGCFNGAAARVQRNVPGSDEQLDDTLKASMGPLLVCSGMPH